MRAEIAPLRRGARWLRAGLLGLAGVLQVSAQAAEIKVLTAGAVCGPEKAVDLFEAAYDEHAQRIARYFAGIHG